MEIVTPQPDGHASVDRRDVPCEPDKWCYHALLEIMEVDVADALRMYFDADEVKKIVEQYGAKGPRRLVLTAGLLVTGGDAMLREKLHRDLKEELRQNVKQKVEHQEKVVKVAVIANSDAPTAENALALKAAKTKLVSLQAELLLTSTPDAAEGAEGAEGAEWKFWNTVRREVVCLDERECFAEDETCLHEIGRIDRLTDGFASSGQRSDASW